jgi:multiple sugar transport system permease protein
MEIMNKFFTNIKKATVFDKLKNRSFKDALSTLLLLLPYAILFSIFIAIPVAVAIFLSFTNFNAVESPGFVGLQNYIALFTQDEVFLKYVLPNTLKYALIVGPGGYVLSFLVAWMLAQIQSVPRTILSLIMYMPSMLGGVFISVIWKTIFSGDEQGYLNSLLLNLDFITEPIQWLQSPEYLMPIMMIVTLWGSMGVGFLAMLSGMLGINKELYEAGYIDGIKNRFQEMVNITIPSMKNQMLFGAVMAIVSAFSSGAIGVQLSGANPTPQYAGQMLVNHIDDYGVLRKELGMSAAYSVILLLIVYAFNKIFGKLFREKD